MKKKILSTLALLLALMLLFTACKDNGKDPQNGGSKNWATGELPADLTLFESDLSALDLTFSKSDLNHGYFPASHTAIEFSPERTKITGVGAVCADDNTVTISTAGCYVLSGQAPVGRIVIDAPKVDKVNLILNGVNLHAANGPVIYVKSAEKVTITLAKDSDNKLSDAEGTALVDDGTTLDAAIFSKEDLAINGTGKLSVMGNLKHGIDSKDDLIITGGIIKVDALGVAIGGNDCVKICGGEITLAADGDGIQADNITEAHRGFVYIQNATVTATVKGDAIQASNALIVESGKLNLTTFGSSDPTASAKGLKSDSDVVIKGGEITVNAAEDAVNSKKSIVISGGALTLDAADDGINADADVIIRDGQINVQRANKAIKGQDVLIAGGTHTLISEGDGIDAYGDATLDVSAGNLAITGGYLYVSAKKDCLDANTSIFITGGVTLVDGESTDKNVTLNANEQLTVSGGVLIATGSVETVKSVTAASNQGVMQLSFAQQSAATPLVVYDANGTAVVSFTPTKAYSAALISAPELQYNAPYTLCAGGTVTGANANGFAQNAAYTKGTDLFTVRFATNVFNQLVK